MRRGGTVYVHETCASSASWVPLPTVCLAPRPIRVVTSNQLTPDHPFFLDKNHNTFQVHTVDQGDGNFRIYVAMHATNPFSPTWGPEHGCSIDVWMELQGTPNGVTYAGVDNRYTDPYPWLEVNTYAEYIGTRRRDLRSSRCRRR